MVAIVACVAIICLAAYGSVALIHGVDTVLTVAVSGALAAIIAAAATYLKVTGPEASE